MTIGFGGSTGTRASAPGQLAVPAVPVQRPLRRPLRSGRTLACALIGALACNLSFAQEIEEVIVTATKREQSAQDVGVAITAFTDQEIRDLRLENPIDLAAQTPGLSTANATTGGTPIFAIRGIGLDDFNINNSSGVGVYVDQVFTSSPMLLSFQLMDVERIEVLKGPQGTLYGKNTTGGAINFVTFDPSEDFEARVTAGYSRWQRFDLDGFVNGPLADSVNGRLAFSFTKQNEGWQTDIDNGRKYGKPDRYALRGKLSIALGEATDILLNAHYGADRSLPFSPQNDDSEARANDTLGYGGLLDGLLDVPPDSTSVRVGDLPLDRDETAHGGSMTISHDFASATFLSISAYESYDRNVVDNYDGTVVSFLDLDQSEQLDQVSQEFRLTSRGSGAYTWVAGLVYSRDVIDVADDFLLIDSAGINLTTAYEQTSKSWGAYFHNEYGLTDRVTLIGGIRYSDDWRRFAGGTYSTDGSDTFGALEAITGAPVAAGDAILVQDESRSERNVSGKLGVDFRVNDDTLLYGNVSTSYKAGIFYGGVGTEPGVLDYVEPEKVTAWEIGFKSTLADRTFQLNGAFFSNDYKDRQSLVIVEDSALFLVATLANIPKSSINGAEMDFWWKPTEGLDLKGGIAYLDSSVKQDLTAADVRGLSLFSSVPAGTELAQAPQWTYNFLGSYTWGIGTLISKAQLSWSWADSQFAALADPVARYGPIRSLGARWAVGAGDGTWELALWGQNLLDTKSDTYSFTNNSAARTVYRQKPFNYGITFSYFFL